MISTKKQTFWLELYASILVILVFHSKLFAAAASVYHHTDLQEEFTGLHPLCTLGRRQWPVLGEAKDLDNQVPDALTGI